MKEQPGFVPMNCADRGFQRLVMALPLWSGVLVGSAYGPESASQPASTWNNVTDRTQIGALNFLSVGFPVLRPLPHGPIPGRSLRDRKPKGADEGNSLARAGSDRAEPRATGSVLVHLDTHHRWDPILVDPERFGASRLALLITTLDRARRRSPLRVGRARD